MFNNSFKGLKTFNILSETNAKRDMRDFLNSCSPAHLTAVRLNAFPLLLFPQFTSTDTSQTKLPEQRDQTAFL
jgi:hypothetical protein